MILLGATTVTVQFTLAALGIALVVASWRTLKGPTLADRVVALDLVGYLIVGLIAVAAIAAERPVMLSVALVAALILFIGTVAFAVHLERRARR